MKRILFGLLVAGVALSASAFSPSASFTFYNTDLANPNSVDPAKYVYRVTPLGACNTDATKNCSVILNFTAPAAPSDGDLLSVYQPGTITSTIQPGQYLED